MVGKFAIAPLPTIGVSTANLPTLRSCSG